MHHVHHIFAGVSRLVSMRCLAPWAALGVALFPLVVSAGGVIDFETIPGGTPSDGLAITTQFQATHGVTFSLEGGGSPVLAQVGSPRTAFQGHGLADDTPAPGQNVGQFFLTDDGIVDRNPPALIITYNTLVAAASGVLIDIDGPESWRLEARDASNSVVASVTLTPGSENAGEGRAAPWAFTRPSADIHAIRIKYTGPTDVAVGLAFDNFSSSGGDLVLAITEDVEPSGLDGWRVTYNLLVTNLGSEEVRDVPLQYQLPDQVRYESASGAGATCSLRGAEPPPPPPLAGGVFLCRGIDVPGHSTVTVRVVTRVTNASDLEAIRAEVNRDRRIPEQDFTNNVAETTARIPLQEASPDDTWRAMEALRGAFDFRTSLTGNERQCVGWQIEIRDRLDALLRTSPHLFTDLSYGPITDEGHNGVVVYLSGTNYHATGVVIQGTAAPSQYGPGGTWLSDLYVMTFMPDWQADIAIFGLRIFESGGVHQVQGTEGRWFEGDYPELGTPQDLPAPVGCPIAPDALGVSTGSPVEILLTNSRGERVQTQNAMVAVNELPVSFFAYKFWNDSSQSIDWDLVLPIDDYEIDLVGTGSGPYTLTVTTFGPSGAPRRTVKTGTTSVGQVDHFSVVTTVPTPLAIDIKPGSFPNSINPRSRGIIPVAILTTATFDATTVDPRSVEFGPGKAKEAHGRGHIEDVDGDGDDDLVLHFRTQQSGIACGQTSAVLTGVTEDGQEIQGEDSIQTMGCK